MQELGCPIALGGLKRGFELLWNFSKSQCSMVVAGLPSDLSVLIERGLQSTKFAVRQLHSVQG